MRRYWAVLALTVMPVLGCARDGANSAASASNSTLIPLPPIDGAPVDGPTEPAAAQSPFHSLIKWFKARDAMNADRMRMTPQAHSVPGEG